MPGAESGRWAMVKLPDTFQRSIRTFPLRLFLYSFTSNPAWGEWVCTAQIQSFAYFLLNFSCFLSLYGDKIRNVDFTAITDNPFLRLQLLKRSYRDLFISMTRICSSQGVWNKQKCSHHLQGREFHYATIIYDVIFELKNADKQWSKQPILLLQFFIFFHFVNTFADIIRRFCDPL